MRNFLFRFLAGVIALALAASAYVQSGFVDPRADIPINGLEKAVAMPSLDASVDRHAPEVKSPLDSSDATLIAGMKIYLLSVLLFAVGVLVSRVVSVVR